MRVKPPPPSRKKTAARDTRFHILDAAEQIFADKGFRGTGTREIARLAGMDKYAIYYHFQNKETLYRAVIERSFSRMTQFVDELFPPEAVSLEELERTFENLLKFLVENTAILKIMQRESLDGTDVGASDIFRKYFRPLFRKGVRFSEKAKKSGWFRQDLNSRQFIAGLYTMVMSYFSDGAMISLLLGEDALSKKMLRERKSLLARFVMDNRANGTRA